MQHSLFWQAILGQYVILRKQSESNDDASVNDDFSEVALADLESAGFA